MIHAAVAATLPHLSRLHYFNWSERLFLEAKNAKYFFLTDKCFGGSGQAQLSQHN